LYDKVKGKATKKGGFGPLDKIKDIDFEYKTSTQKGVAYGTVYSKENEIYHGMSEKVSDFFNANGRKNFVMVLHKLLNHFLAMPFDIFKRGFSITR
jgi:hypothetical protein